jgi:K+-sensing histidine kinase KdpD
VAVRFGSARRLSEVSDRHPYASAAIMVAAITAFGFAAGRTVQSANLDVLYLLAVFVSGLRAGRRPALACALAGAIVFSFCFVSPRYSFHASDLPYLITLVGFVLVAIVTSELASRARERVLAERARADAEAARARAESARAEMEATGRAKDALLNQIAHELRSPLTAILGRVQLLQKTEPASALPLDKLEHSAHVLARLVGDLVDASRMHAGKLRVRPEPILLLPSVAAIVDDLALAAGQKGIVLERDLEAVPPMLADGDRIEQIVANLVTNAIKFTPRGGRVAVHLRETDGTIALTVVDTGVGISPEFLPRIFDPFTQADGVSKQDGLGLGLSIVRHLVAAHGGRITVESAGLGAGTTVLVTLPCAQGMAAGGISIDANRANAIH